jgi:hypothetical protein
MRAMKNLEIKFELTSYIRSHSVSRFLIPALCHQTLVHKKSRSKRPA